MGLSGELIITTRVCGVIAAASVASVSRKSGGVKLDGLDHGARGFRDRAIGIIGRLDQHHFVARPGQRHDRGGQRLGAAGGDQHFVSPSHSPGRRIVRHAPTIAWRNSGTPGMGGYWLGPSISALRPPRADRFRPVLVGKALAQIDGLVLGGERRHDGEDGGALAGEDGIESGQNGSWRRTFAERRLKA